MAWGVGTCSREGAYKRLGAYSRKYATLCYRNIIFLTLKFCKKIGSVFPFILKSKSKGRKESLPFWNVLNQERAENNKKHENINQLMRFSALGDKRLNALRRSVTSNGLE